MISAHALELKHIRCKVKSLNRNHLTSQICGKEYMRLKRWKLGCKDTDKTARQADSDTFVTFELKNSYRDNWSIFGYSEIISTDNKGISKYSGLKKVSLRMRIKWA